MTSPHPRLTERPNGGWDARLRIFRAGDEVDTCALVTERFVVLVDTMATPELAAAVLAAIRTNLTGRQLIVVNTHADWDHCWGNATFATPTGSRPAPIIGHARAADRLRGATERAVLLEKQRAEPRFASVRLVPPMITFTGELTIEGGDATLHLIPTPGHTPDHIAVWVPEMRTLLAGDAAEHPFPCVGQPETLPQLRQSLRQLEALRPTTVIPCHGGTTDAGLLARNLAYFDTLERHARDAVSTATLPPDWRTLEDLPAQLGLSYEQAVQFAGADPASISAVYRAFHLEAARAMVATVLAS